MVLLAVELLAKTKSVGCCNSAPPAPGRNQVTKHQKPSQKRHRAVPPHLLHPLTGSSLSAGIGILRRQGRIGGEDEMETVDRPASK